MTIEVPTPSADLISQVETATIETNQAEIAAVMAIHEKFSPYGRWIAACTTMTPPGNGIDARLILDTLDKLEAFLNGQSLNGQSHEQ